jgi:hypothetical protein
MLDLPERSIVVGGIDRWDMHVPGMFRVIEEPRLARLLHRRLVNDPRLGVHRPPDLRTPPVAPNDKHVPYIVLVYGEFGWMAQTDPDELFAHLRILERRVQQLLPPADAAPVLASLSEVGEGCLSPKESKSGWDTVEVHAKRVSSRLKTASSLLSLTESNSDR